MGLSMDMLATRNRGSRARVPIKNTTNELRVTSEASSVMTAFSVCQLPTSEIRLAARLLKPLIILLQSSMITKIREMNDLVSKPLTICYHETNSSIQHRPMLSAINSPRTLVHFLPQLRPPLGSSPHFRTTIQKRLMLSARLSLPIRLLRRPFPVTASLRRSAPGSPIPIKLYCVGQWASTHHSPRKTKTSSRLYFAAVSQGLAV